ncbi:phage tail tape measure protein [Marinicrinis sediminis]|uniref:Phage tail tape measure protein n=1 Tax=Marinicrinis sediminis TaxID=1652465 RepID=A0ABW5RAR5_9BACL
MGTINTILNLRDRFTSRMRNAADQTRQHSRQMRLLGNRVESFRNTAVSGFTSVAKSATTLGVAFVGVSAAAESIGNGVQFMKDYHSSMTNLQAATGVTDAEMLKLKNSITELYKMNMGESWSDLSNAMMNTKQITGQVGDELKQTTALAVTYRDVFGEDLSQSVKTADTMMKNFGISSTEAFNLLSQGSREGLNKSQDLLDTANEYSVYFKTLGFNANEMFDMFSAGAENGAFNLDKVADSVKEFGIRIKDNSKSSREALSALGFNADSMIKTFAMGGEEAKQSFKQVVSAISGMNDPIQKNAIGVDLFGTQFENMESDVISALGTARNQFDMTRDTMQEIQKIKYDNTSQAFQGIGRMVETNVLIPISDRVLPKLNEFGQWFKDKAPEIEKAIDKAFETGAEIIDGFATSISWAKDNADWLIPVVSGLTATILAQKVVGTVSKMYQAWTLATKGQTMAQIALNIASKASPFGWIATVIGLVVVAGVALWKNWDTVKEKGQALWTSLQNVWGNIKSFIMDTVSNVADWLDSFPLGQTFLESVRGVVDNVKQIFGGITEFFSSVFKGDWEGAWDGIMDMFKGQIGLITTYAKTPINGLIDMINTLIDGLNSLSIEIPSWVPGYGGESWGIDIPKIPKFGLGTSYFTGGLAMVNERNGGEIVNLPGGSQVIPADKSEQLINNMSNRNVTVNIKVSGDIIGEEDKINRLMNRAVEMLEIKLSNMQGGLA